MSCKTCKQKRKIIESDEFNKKADLVERSVITFTIIWTIFALYGLYHIIVDIVSLFKKIL